MKFFEVEAVEFETNGHHETVERWWGATTVWVPNPPAVVDNGKLLVPMECITSLGSRLYKKKLPYGLLEYVPSGSGRYYMQVKISKASYDLLREQLLKE